MLFNASMSVVKQQLCLWHRSSSLTFTSSTFDALAQFISSAICGMVSSNVWHLSHMIQREVSATGKTQITGDLFGGGGLTSVSAVGPMMKLRVDYATYLVKSLCNSDDDEWPFTAGAHIAKPKLTR